MHIRNILNPFSLPCDQHHHFHSCPSLSPKSDPKSNLNYILTPFYLLCLRSALFWVLGLLFWILSHLFAYLISHLLAKKSKELSVTLEVRRFFAGKSSFRNTGEKVIPHYLRTSTDSYHDFCKYGRKHAFETKEWRVGGWMPRSEKRRKACSWNCKASIILYLQIHPSKAKLIISYEKLIKERFNFKYGIGKKKLLDCGAVSSDIGESDINGGYGTRAVVVLVAAIRSGEGRQTEARGCGSRQRRREEEFTMHHVFLVYLIPSSCYHWITWCIKHLWLSKSILDAALTLCRWIVYGSRFDW